MAPAVQHPLDRQFRTDHAIEKQMGIERWLDSKGTKTLQFGMPETTHPTDLRTSSQLLDRVGDGGQEPHGHALAGVFKIPAELPIEIFVEKRRSPHLDTHSCLRVR